MELTKEGIGQVDLNRRARSGKSPVLPSTSLSLNKMVIWNKNEWGVDRLGPDDSEKGLASWRSDMFSPGDDARMKLTEPTARIRGALMPEKQRSPHRLSTGEMVRNATCGTGAAFRPAATEICLRCQTKTNSCCRGGGVWMQKKKTNNLLILFESGPKQMLCFFVLKHCITWIKCRKSHDFSLSVSDEKMWLNSKRY